MKNLRRLLTVATFCGLLIAVRMTVGSILVTEGSARGTAPPASPQAGPTLSPVLAFVVPPPQAGHPAFDLFSWQSFVALNWPAAIDPNTHLPIRGMADTSPGVGVGSPGPRVWETWKADWELFGLSNSPAQPQPTDWSSWDNGSGMNPCGGQPSPPGAKQLVMVTKMDEVTGSVTPGFNQAMSGPLIDQHRNYVRYEIRLNKPEYETIKKNQWYLAASQPPSGVMTLPMSVPGTYGAVEVKAAWREMTPEEMATPAVIKRYYIVQTQIVEPGQPCRTVPVGLVGLHIAHKTSPFAEWV